MVILSSKRSVEGVRKQERLTIPFSYEGQGMLEIVLL